jgi:hypothetical protein
MGEAGFREKDGMVPSPHDQMFDQAASRLLWCGRACNLHNGYSQPYNLFSTMTRVGPTNRRTGDIGASI